MKVTLKRGLFWKPDFLRTFFGLSSNFLRTDFEQKPRHLRKAPFFRIFVSESQKSSKTNNNRHQHKGFCFVISDQLDGVTLNELLISVDARHVVHFVICSFYFRNEFDWRIEIKKKANWNWWEAATTIKPLHLDIWPGVLAGGARL